MSRPVALGLVGSPVAHSLSPRLHRAALAALGRDGDYVAHDVAPDALEGWLDAAWADGALDGCNVTTPHKLAVARWAEVNGALDDEAREVGAVNTVVFAPSDVVATNTDARGLAAVLTTLELTPGRVVVLGSGGAVRAVLVALARTGLARELVIVARDRDGARRHLDDLAARASSRTSFLALDDVGLGRALADTALVVQATSASLGPASDAFVEAFPFAALPPETHLVDLAYGRSSTRLGDTPWLAAGRQRGLTTDDGLGMLVEQAALALRTWLTAIDGEAPSGEAFLRLRSAMYASIDRPIGD